MDPPQKRRKLAPKAPQAASPSHAATQNLSAASTIIETGNLPSRVEFERFARHLQDAAMLIQRSAERPSYTSVKAIVLRWKEDHVSESDAASMHAVLRDHFNFPVERWNIPSSAAEGEPPSTLLGLELSKLAASESPDTLLVVYYVGHGFIGPRGQVYWACNATPNSPKIKWSGIKCLLEDSAADILFLLDTCAVVTAAISGSFGAKQVIAATNTTKAPCNERVRSFTSYLAESLHAFGSTKITFSTQALYEDVVARQRSDQLVSPNGTPTTVPVPVAYNMATGKWSSISLTPVPAGGFAPVFRLDQLNVSKPDPEQPRRTISGSGTASITPEAVMDLKFDEPRVLACTTFVGEASTDMTFFNTWLSDHPDIADKVAVEAMFFGPPTMLLISMAMPIWEVVRHDKVCIFLGYIGSHNFVHLYQNLVGFTGSRRTLGTVSREVEDGRILLEAREAAKRRADEELGPDGIYRKNDIDDVMGELHFDKDDVEESAEMKEAAEQLKALSHTRHPMTDSIQGRRRSTLPDSAPLLHDVPEVEVAIEEVPESIARPKTTRRSIPKAVPRNETRCSHCSHTPFKDSSSLRKHIAAAHTRPFPCAFSFAGCVSTFGSKNEWKRHISSQHLCLQYYRCSACPASAAEGKFNEFNRKDLFTQHLRRMHAPFAIKKNAGKADAKLQAEWEATVKEMQQSCLVQRRLPPQRSACPKADCQSVFEGATSWDEWTEHVGRHMEKGEAQGMGIDRNLASWALDEGIIEGDPNTGEYRLVPDVTYSGRHHEHHHQPITLPHSTNSMVSAAVTSQATGITASPGSASSDQKRKRSDWRGDVIALGSMEVDGES